MLARRFFKRARSAAAGRRIPCLVRWCIARASLHRAVASWREKVCVNRSILRQPRKLFTVVYALWRARATCWARGKCCHARAVEFFHWRYRYDALRRWRQRCQMTNGASSTRGRTAAVFGRLHAHACRSRMVCSKIAESVLQRLGRAYGAWREATHHGWSRAFPVVDCSSCSRKSALRAALGRWDLNATVVHAYHRLARLTDVRRLLGALYSWLAWSTTVGRLKGTQERASRRWQRRACLGTLCVWSSRVRTALRVLFDLVLAKQRQKCLLRGLAELMGIAFERARKRRLLHVHLASAEFHFLPQDQYVVALSHNWIGISFCATSIFANCHPGHFLRIWTGIHEG